MDLTIDKDRLDFLLYAYFGSDKNPFLSCSKRAYLDMCRTLRLNGKCGEPYREYIDFLLEEEIKSLLSGKNCNQKDYDIWHYNLCIKLIDYYKNEGFVFTIGQAQKWINMMMKYLYIQGSVTLSEIFPYLHIPLDN